VLGEGWNWGGKQFVRVGISNKKVLRGLEILYHKLNLKMVQIVQICAKFKITNFGMCRGAYFVRNFDIGSIITLYFRNVALSQDIIIAQALYHVCHWEFACRHIPTRMCALHTRKCLDYVLPYDHKSTTKGHSWHF